MNSHQEQNRLRPPSVILHALSQDAVDWKYLNGYSYPIGRSLLRGAVLLYEESVKNHLCRKK